MFKVLSLKSFLSMSPLCSDWQAKRGWQCKAHKTNNSSWIFFYFFLNTLYSKCERLTYIHICLNWKMRHQQCTEIWIETETYKQLLVGIYQQSDVGWVEVQVMLQQGRPEQGGFSFKTGFETMLQYNIELTLQHSINHRNSVPVYLCSESTYCHTQLHYQTSKACSRNNQCHQEYNYHLNIKCVSDYVF